ncbi:MAG: fatty acid desaturase [Verrucomicrobiaceae bacterium]|nr:fatty acid desaturase [Verrucomicrobiaceae bacterium]
MYFTRPPSRRKRTSSPAQTSRERANPFHVPSLSPSPQAVKTGRELILATKPYAHDSRGRSWWYVLSTTLLVVLALAGTHWNFNLPAKLLCSVLSGLLLLRLFVIYHDHQHHAILDRSWVAERFMRVFGILSLSPSCIWRSSHNHHHSHNSKLRGSHIGSFPIMTKGQYRKSPPSARFKYLFMRHPLTILFGYVFVFILGMCIGPFLNSPKKNYDCLIALIVHVAIGFALVHYWGWMGLLLTQTIPHFVLYAFGSYLFYAQHNFPGATFNDKSGWTYEKAALESSSYMRTSRLMAWFTANIGYHHIHHLNARIPFYRLPQVYREMPELQSTRLTSLHPLEIWRCLRLKVWDVDQQRMVGLDKTLRRTKPAPVV